MNKNDTEDGIKEDKTEGNSSTGDNSLKNREGLPEGKSNEDPEKKEEALEKLPEEKKEEAPDKLPEGKKEEASEKLPEEKKEEEVVKKPEEKKEGEQGEKTEDTAGKKKEKADHEIITIDGSHGGTTAVGEGARAASAGRDYIEKQETEVVNCF